LLKKSQSANVAWNCRQTKKPAHLADLFSSTGTLVFPRLGRLSSAAGAFAAGAFATRSSTFCRSFGRSFLSRSGRRGSLFGTRRLSSSRLFSSRSFFGTTACAETCKTRRGGQHEQLVLKSRIHRVFPPDELRGVASFPIAANATCLPDGLSL
jgi:hypothetical protein